jgi:HD superfamily phosphohydrolase
MVVKDAKPNFPRLLSLHEALGEIGRPQTSWNEKWLKRTIKNNFITYSKTGSKWFITEEDLWELLRSIQVRCLNSKKTRLVHSTISGTQSSSQTEESSGLEKVQNALLMKTQKPIQLEEKKKFSKNLKGNNQNVLS